MANTPRTSGVFSLGALSADNAFEAPSLDLNFDGQASSFTRATTSPTAAKANGDQLATDIISCTRSTTATFMGSNGLIQTAAVNTPRVEFDASGNPLGLLVEESRTNLYPGTTPNNTAAVTFTTNQGTAPDGTNTAIKATENSALGEKNANTSQFSVTSGTQYTASLFAKPAGRTGIRLLLPGAAFGTNHVATYDFQGNGSIIEWSGSSAPEATTITPSGNGWYRISITGTAASTVSTAFIQLVIDDDGTDTNTSYQGDGSSGLLIWGIQVEEGAGPTSYIPTTSGSVTRAADDITLATSDFGYLSSTGTSAIDVTVASKTEGNNFPNIFQFQGATDQDRIFLRSNQSAVNGGIVDTQHRDGGTATNTSVLSAPLTWPYTLSFAMAHEGTEMRKALDGTLQAPRTLNQALSNPHSTLGLGISLSSSARVMNGHIRRFTYWPRALSDEQLAAYSGDLDFAGEGLTSTGILSLSELLQASYGLPVGPASVDIVLSLWGGGGGGGGTRNASSGDTEESGAGGNGAYLEVQISGPLATDAVLKRYVGGGGSGANASSGLDHALGGAGGAATVVVLENAAGTSFLPIAVAAAGGGGGGAGSQAAADAGPGAGGAAVDSSTGLTTTPRNSPEVSNTSGGDAAGGGTSTAGGAQPSPNGRASSSPGSSRTTANGLTIAQDGGRGATNRNAANGSGNSGGSNGSPYGGDGGSTASTAPGSHGDGDGGGGGGGWYGGSGGGCASGGGEGGSGGGAGSSYVNVGTHTFEGQDITITVRSSVVGAQNPYTGMSWVSANNSNTGYWGSATSNTGKGGNGTSAAEAGGANGNAGAVHVGPLDGSLVSSVTSAGVAADIDIATITA